MFGYGLYQKQARFFCYLEGEAAPLESRLSEQKQNKRKVFDIQIKMQTNVKLICKFRSPFIFTYIAIVFTCNRLKSLNNCEHSKYATFFGFLISFSYLLQCVGYLTLHTRKGAGVTAKIYSLKKLPINYLQGNTYSPVISY